MKKILPFLICFYCIASYARVASYPLPSCYTTSAELSLRVNGTDIPVINNSTIYNYAHFSFSGNITIEITANQYIRTQAISPLSYNLSGSVNGNKLTFTLDRSRYLIVKINDLKNLIIAADDLEISVPSLSAANVFNVLNKPFKADGTGTLVTTSAIQKAIDAANNNPSGGIVYVPAGVYLCGNLILKSNVHVYLEGGAVIRGTGNAADFTKHYRKSSIKKDGSFFIYTAQNADNIKIYGRGTIDGNGIYMRKNSNMVNNLIVPLGCTNFTIDGIVCRDSGLWGVIPTRSEYVTIQNTKHFNEISDDTDSYEDDAVDVQESKHVVIKHTIMISEDDAFSTKTWTNDTDMAMSWPGQSKTLDDVLVDDCVAWSRCATFKVGFGNFQNQSDITIRNATSYQSMRALAVNPRYGEATVANVTFEDIEIEDFWPRKGNASKWLDISNYQESTIGGPIKNLSFKNINIRNFGNAPSNILGHSKAIPIDGIKFENINVPQASGYATSLSELNISNINDNVLGVQISPREKK